MKRIICGVVAAVLLIGVLLGCAPAAPTGPIELKAVAFLSLGRSLTGSIETVYVDMVKKASNGELIIDFIGGAEVIPATEQVDSVADGVIDMAFVPSGEYRHIVPQIGAIHLTPYSSPSGEREAGLYDYWVEIHEKQNLRYLGRWSWDIWYYTHLGNKRVERIEDFKGLKIFVLGRMENLFKEMGAIPIDIPTPEVYTAMERGVIDGYQWSSAGHVPGWEEVTEYVLDFPFSNAATFTILLNLDKFHALPKHLRDVLIDVTAQYEPISGEYFHELAMKDRQLYLDAGVEFIHLAPEDEKWIQENADRFVWEYVEKELLKDDPAAFAELREVLTK